MNKRNAIIGVIVLGAVISIFAWQQANNNNPEKTAAVRPASRFSMKNTPVKTFGVDLATGLATPSEPTINPTDPYNPMPLRVGTVGATTFHRPFCPYAKQSLQNHGPEKRINYWTREQVAESGRPGDHFCLAEIFDCSSVEPYEFAASENDPWCGANIRSQNYHVEGVNEVIAGKTLCSLQGRIGIFVDNAEDCVNGAVRGSSVGCDQSACSACTVDCDSACAGCTKITMAVLNKVTLAMGDANADGEADINDYLYYHECYSGPVAATLPCQNVFDFDNDTDVDVIDFDMFVQAYNTGNVSWATANFPGAEINPPKLRMPLRVGTEGSQYYHRLDCPSVNNSWQTYGIDRRLDYYTWDQIESSGRVPDGNVCLPGTRDNPSGSWQNCTLDDDGDGTLNCEDPCPGDPQDLCQTGG